MIEHVKCLSKCPLLLLLGLLFRHLFILSYSLERAHEKRNQFFCLFFRPVGGGLLSIACIHAGNRNTHSCLCLLGTVAVEAHVNLFELVGHSEGR